MMRWRIPLTALLAIETLVFPTPSLACPDRDLTLWELVQRSDLVVRARVVRIEADQTAKSPFDQDDSDHVTTVFEVIETWKGHPPGEIVLESEQNVVSLETDQTVIAFLESGESRARSRLEFADGLVAMETVSWRGDGYARVPDISEWKREPVDVDPIKERIRRFADWALGRWFSIAVRDDSKLADEDFDALKELTIRAAELLLSSGDGDDARREWVVRAAEKPATRSQVLDELSLLEPDDLTDAQTSRLAAAFVRSPAFDGSDVATLSLLRGHADPQVDRAATSLVEAGLQMQSIPGWVVDLVDEVLRRYGDNLGARIGPDDLDLLRWTAYGGEDLPTIWEAARRELGIPAVPPAEPPPP